MQTIYLDISSKIPVPVVYAKQGEVGRKFRVVISDNGVAYNITEDTLLSVWYEGDTDTGNYSSIGDRNALWVEDHVVTVELVAQMLLNPGNGNLCLTMTRADGGEISTWNIPYCVEKKPGAGSSVPSEYYTALSNAGAAAAAQVALAAEQAVLATSQVVLAKAEKEAAETYKTQAERAADRAQTASSDAKNVVDERVDALRNILIPVGYIFTWEPVAGDDTDLSTAEAVYNHFGIGSWEQIKNVFLYSVDEEGNAGQTGGKSTQTLTVENLPAHSHSVPNITIPNTGIEGAFLESYGQGGGSSRNIVTGDAGGGEPFSIMPPYRTVYMWKRID